MKNRSRSDIIYELVLSIEKKPETKTKIMYTAYLSTNQTNTYMNEALDSDLISYNVVTRTYSITAKGHLLLKLYRELQKLINFNKDNIPLVPHLPDEIEKAKRINTATEEFEEELERYR